MTTDRRPADERGDLHRSRVLIYGSRTWRDPKPIKAFIGSLPADAVVIHGGAPGADSIAGRAAENRGLTVIVYRADWHAHGKAAGPIRNRRMIVDGQPTYARGFRMPGESRGTDDMTRQLVAADVPHDVMLPAPPDPAAGEEPS